jgi:hypothetical protein
MVQPVLSQAGTGAAIGANTVTAPIVKPDQYPKFRKLWADKKMTLARLANIFRCSESTITETARRLELRPRHAKKKRKWVCQDEPGGRRWKCIYYNFCQHTTGQLPCELEPTPATHEWREISVYHSPNGFWTAEDGRR